MQVMEVLHYKLVKYDNEYEAVCIEYPYITWIADTKEEALAGVQELMFREYLDNGLMPESIKYYINW